MIVFASIMLLPVRGEYICTDLLLFSFFTLVAAIFSFITVYALTEESHGRDMTRKEKPTTSHPEAEVNPETQVNNGHVNNGNINNGNVNNELPPNNVV